MEQQLADPGLGHDVRASEALKKPADKLPAFLARNAACLGGVTWLFKRPETWFLGKCGKARLIRLLVSSGANQAPESENAELDQSTGLAVTKGWPLPAFPVQSACGLIAT